MVRIVSVVIRLGTTSEKGGNGCEKSISNHTGQLSAKDILTPIYMLPVVGDSVECCAMQKVVLLKCHRFIQLMAMGLCYCLNR